MRQPGRWRRVGWVGTLAVCLPAVATTDGWPQAAREAHSPTPVLILNSGTSLSVASQQLEQTIRQELVHADVGALAFFNESLDAYAVANGLAEADLKTYLARKYAGRTPQLVIALGPPAIEFMQRNRLALWKDARVVFAGMPISDIPVDPGFPGVVFRADAEQTMRLAKQLVPKARRVAIVSGASDFDRSLARRTESVLSDAGLGLERLTLSGLTPQALFAAAKTLPSDTVILYTTMFRDATGQTFASRELLERLSQEASVPIFVLFESYLGTGALGGAVTSWREHSLQAGKLAARAARGELSPGNAVTVSGNASCVLDSRLLGRWDIDRNLVPAGCDLRFAAQGAWASDRWWLAGAIAVLVLLFATGGLLLSQLRRRRREDEELVQQREELAHAARLAMIGELTASIAHEINQPLGAILNNADAAEMILESNPQRIEEVKRILADIRRDDLRASEVIRHIRGLLRKSASEVQRVALNEVTADVMRLVGPDAVRRGVIVTQSLARDLPDVLADTVHLRQVVLNLVLNAMDAMKNMDPVLRRVTVSTAYEAERVCVRVADAGPGIAADRLHRIFDSFYTTKKDGLGLGLSIARYLVEANHGRLWAENAAGGGAIFQFSLPVAPMPQAVTPRVESAA